MHKKRRGLEGFRQRGSFIVGCERLIVGEKKMAREMAREKKMAGGEKLLRNH